MRKKVLITHYMEDLSWVTEINPDVDYEIYSTSHSLVEYVDQSKITFIEKNKGLDANMYLTYIIKNYEDLPDKILFTHHHRLHWSHDFPLPYIINNINWDNSDYMNIGCRNCYTNLYNFGPDFVIWREYFKEIWYLFKDYISHPNEQIIYYSGTQFMTSKELILQYPKSFWEKLHEWLMVTPWECWKSGRTFEYLWHYILTKNPVDRIYTNEQLLKLI